MCSCSAWPQLPGALFFQLKKTIRPSGKAKYGFPTCTRERESCRAAVTGLPVLSQDGGPAIHCRGLPSHRSALPGFAFFASSRPEHSLRRPVLFPSFLEYSGPPLSTTYPRIRRAVSKHGARAIPPTQVACPTRVPSSFSLAKSSKINCTGKPLLGPSLFQKLVTDAGSALSSVYRS